MELLENVLSQQIVERLGWTLLHFVWQGAIVAVALAIGLRLLRKSIATLRYLAGCGALVLIVLMPVVTFEFIDVPVSQPVIDTEPEPVIMPVVIEDVQVPEMPMTETTIVLKLTD